MVTHTGKIPYTSASDQNGAVLLQVVPFAGNVNRTFLLVGKTHTCDLSQSGVRLLGGSRGYGQTYAAFLGAVIENRTLRFESDFLSALLMS